MQKTFAKYEEAYTFYSDIVAGHEPDRKNASIFYRENYYIVEWMKK